MDPEKNAPPEKFSQESPPHYPRPGGLENKNGVSEAADLYNSLAAAEGYGYVTRG